MKVLVIGNGAREHAIVWKLRQSKRVSRVYCLPGNGGIAAIAECLTGNAADVGSAVDWAHRLRVDLVIVGPEAPLVAGLVDILQKAKIPVFGPTAQAAQVEGSKSYAKAIMRKYGIPTAEHEVFTDENAALDYVGSRHYPLVIKADGLAAGKGVVVAWSQEEAVRAVKRMMVAGEFGAAGRKIVIEEYLRGEEVSLMAAVSDDQILPLVPAQDYKPVYDGNRGPNTGGMGAYSPVPHLEEACQQAFSTILRPMALALKNEGRPFRGILYAGLMVVDGRPKVVEFNARLGDPETQVILPRLKTDLVDVAEAVLEGDLLRLNLAWEKRAAVSVVLSSPGYPGEYPTGLPISGIESTATAFSPDQAVIFHSGTELRGGRLVTKGGRVLSVTALDQGLTAARTKAYQVISRISFPGMHYRRDIAALG